MINSKAMILAVIITVWNWGGLTLLEWMTLGQQVVAIVGGVLGIAFLWWNWLRKKKEDARQDEKWADYNSERRDRRAAD